MTDETRQLATIAMQHARPTKRSSRAAYNDYMRDYMRRYRQNLRRGGPTKTRTELGANAIYDPRRDGALPGPVSITAALMGDPPIGRRAIDKQLSTCQRPEGAR